MNESQEELQKDSDGSTKSDLGETFETCSTAPCVHIGFIALISAFLYLAVKTTAGELNSVTVLYFFACTVLLFISFELWLRLANRQSPVRTNTANQSGE